MVEKAPAKLTKEQQAAAEAKQKEEEAREAHKRKTDTNYNPLLHNGITNKDVSTFFDINLIADIQDPSFPLRD